jgi:hypothetical protein
MVSVAIIARCGDDQTPLEQAFSMDTLGIIAQNVSFGNVVNPCHRRTLSVAFPAQHRNIHLVSAGSDIGAGEDVVFSMTFMTGRSMGGSSPQSSSMDAGIKFFIGDIMTHPTIHPFEAFWMGEFLDICILMAVDTI